MNFMLFIASTAFEASGPVCLAAGGSGFPPARE
jgi:hypothetical protein